MALWDDPEINKTIALMDPQTRYLYAKIGENMYKKGGVMDAIERSTRSDPESDMFDAATQISLMLRDGLDPSMLTTDERSLMIHVYGVEECRTRFEINVDNNSATDHKITNDEFEQTIG
jgi:hypothetical protein